MALFTYFIAMQHIPVYALKNSLSAVLAKVQSGEEAIITSHRKPIAKIVAYAARQAPAKQGGSTKPAIAGVTWRSGRFLPKQAPTVALVPGSPSVADMLVAQRRGAAQVK